MVHEGSRMDKLKVVCIYSLRWRLLDMCRICVQSGYN
jgi:hypothetical protein